MSDLGSVAKRSIDLTVGTVLFVISLPVQAVIGAVVRASMGRPVLFRQERAGQSGRPFSVIKFRTMTPDDPVKPLGDGDRITRVGSFLRSTSLDELPTFWNVICGQMSLVGPRPLPVSYLSRYTSEQARRHEVRPGITGLAQVSGRNAISWAERLHLDVEYVDTHTLHGDVVILLRTVGSALRREGITAAGSASMPEFTGTTREDLGR